MTAYSPGFRSLDSEVHDYRPDVEGSIPEWLSGTLVRNGPGRFEVGGERLAHWFDGLAMLRRYAFEDGELRYSNRFLRSEAYADAAAGRLTGQFGTDTRGAGRLLDVLRSFGPPEPTDNANVHVARLGGDCVALTETPRRVAFDPETLETHGAFAFDDDLTEHLASAHLVDDPHRGEHVGFATQFGRTPRYHVYRVPEGERRREVVASVEARGPAYVHDCSVTADHVVLVETPLVLPLRRVLDPFASGPVDMLDWQPERGTRVLVVRRDTGDLVADPTLGPAFTFHHLNAYADDGTVTVDLVEFPDASIVDAMRLDRLDGEGYPDVPDGHPVRYRVDVEANAVRRSVLHDCGMELPRVFRRDVGRRHRYAYGQSTHHEGANGLVKLDCETGTTREWVASGVYVEEPIPLERPGATADDDGVVVAPALDAERERTVVMVFDAETLAVEARATLPHAEPFGFHGRFFPEE